MRIQYEDLFKSKLKSGICLFTGAGFSALPDSDGNALPCADELCRDLIKKYNLKGVDYNLGLEYISEFCTNTDYQSYLRTKFTVSKYNILYDAINKINLRAFVTTNIDNIVRLVIDRSQKYFLRNIREYGAVAGAPNEVTYIPLHGEVSDQDFNLFFGKFELSDVDTANSDLFQLMFSTLVKRPILFWGYGFHDTGVLKVVKRLIDMGNSDIWVQVMPNDEITAKIFSEKGCNIIYAKTDELLSWINMNLEDESMDTENTEINDNALTQYKIPTLSKAASVTLNEFYQQGITDWYPILTNNAYERKIVVEAENMALKHKNVIICGGHFTGKTTALMQLSRKVKARNKYFVNDVTREEANYIVHHIGKNKAWVFYNNCCNDINAFNVFATHRNITLIGTADDYQLETVKHLFDPSVEYKTIDCSEIDEKEARNIYQKIPVGFRKRRFLYKSTLDEKFSMFEMMARNVDKVYSRKQVEKMIDELYRKDEDMFKIIAITSYLYENGSALSYIIVSHMLDINIYPNAVDLVDKTSSYLRDYNVLLEKEQNTEDYYILRSKLFAINARIVLTSKYKQQFAKVIKDFISKESRYNILRYDVFRRKAFDAELFHSLFSQRGANALYQLIYQKDDSVYILQQLALCQSLFGDYINAFNNIDKAISVKPHNFSFKNSRAIIMFMKNKNNFTKSSMEYMKKAMEILKDCYRDDKRKLYHARRFAEFAIILAESYECCDYLQDALDWLSDEENTKPLPKKILYLKGKLIDLISQG